MHHANQGLEPRSKKGTQEAIEGAYGGRNSMEPMTMTARITGLSQQQLHRNGHF